MTILVTGARGNIGSRVVAKLTEAGHSVLTRDRHRGRMVVLTGPESHPARTFREWVKANRAAF